MSTRVEPLITVADLDAMPEDDNRYEVIEGELFLSRAPSLTHQRICVNLVVMFRTYLDKHPIGEVLTTPGVIFSQISGVIPDVLFMSNERRALIATGDRISGPPELVIEVLSPGPENTRRDRVVKRQLYGKYGVVEYWVVDPESQSVEVYILDGETLRESATYGVTDEIHSSLLQGLVCRVESIFHY